MDETDPSALTVVEDHQDTQRTFRGEISFECRVDRVEAIGSVDSDDVDARLDWDLYRSPTIEGKTHHTVIATGHLYAISAGGVGQALVVGFLRVRNESVAKLHLDPAELLEGFVEEMYDAARRLLNSLAGQMDIGPFEIPSLSPPSEISLLDHDEDAEHGS